MAELKVGPELFYSLAIENSWPMVPWHIKPNPGKSKLWKFLFLLSWPQFDFTNGYEMMRKAWSNIEEVSYYFSMSSLKFQGHTWQKIADFDPNWGFPDSNFSLSSLLAMKWCLNLKQHRRGALVFFQSHPLNFKVTRRKKSPILTRVGRFRTVTLVWINWWRWNDAQSLT